MMKCRNPRCTGSLRVEGSVTSDDGARNYRRRKCDECGLIVYTMEAFEPEVRYWYSELRCGKRRKRNGEEGK